MSMVSAKPSDLERHCPACGGAFTISAGSRKKKVQCPQCREVVTMTEPDASPGTPSPDAGPEVPAAPDWMARCEMLQARIEVLEHQVEALMVTPRTSAPLVSERLPDFPPLPRDNPRPADPPESLEAFAPLEHTEPRKIFRAEAPADETPPAEVILRKVQPAVPEIGLLVAAGDGAGLRLAGTLTELLARAGWKVRAPAEDTLLSKSCRGLTLAAPPSLPLPRVTSTLNALRDAGYAMTFQLDPARGLDETVLIVGTGLGSG